MNLACAPQRVHIIDADHMLERCRLFLLIALGESVLSSGTALADAPRTLLTLVTGTAALATIVALWALHFAASGHLLDRYVQTTTDPIFAARRTVNGLLVLVAGLVAVAVGNELVITHPHGQGGCPARRWIWVGASMMDPTVRR